MIRNIRRAAVRGFTLIEILIVVVILGILAAIIIPQFTDAADSAGVASARTQLQTMRSQIELFYSQVGKYPGAALPADGPYTAGQDWSTQLNAGGYLRSATVSWPALFTATYAVGTGGLTLAYTGTYDVDGPSGSATPAAAVAAW